MLALCPAMAVTTSGTNRLGMGLATTAVLVTSNVLGALIRRTVSSQVRIPVFVVLIASLVTIVDMVINAWLHELYKVLGLFIALIVVNCADENFWNNLSQEKLEYLDGVVKPSFRTVADVDFKAMRFEKDIVEVSLANLKEEKDKFETLKVRIIEELGEIPLSINIVAKEEQLIRQAQTNNFWATITVAKFDELIQKLSPLMKFREAIIPLAPAKFNLKDFVSEKEFIEFGPEHQALSIAKYRELVEQKINELVLSNPILQKLKEGIEITEQEAEQLAEKLHDENPHITIDLLRRVYNHRKAVFVQFIKHILGIEILQSFPETVSKAFDDFIAAHSYLTSRQLQFLDLLRKYIIENGELTRKNLIESPFTLLHP